MMAAAVLKRQSRPLKLALGQIQDLLDELESSKQSRLRAWNVLQGLRSVLSDLGDAAIPSPGRPARRGLGGDDRRQHQ